MEDCVRPQPRPYHSPASDFVSDLRYHPELVKKRVAEPLPMEPPPKKTRKQKEVEPTIVPTGGRGKQMKVPMKRPDFIPGPVGPLSRKK
jgi:hypothetical protein